MKRVLCFGDSNTWGMIPLKGQRYDDETRWPSAMGKLLGPEYTVIEEGLCGRTTVFEDNLMPHCNGIKYLPACLMSHNPLDLVIIMLGTNDLKIRLSLTAIDIARGVNLLIQEVKRYSPNAKILIMSPPYIGEGIANIPGNEGMGKQAVEKSKLLHQYYEAFAKDNGCHYIKISDYVEASEADCIHLTAEAHIKMAQVISKKVKEIL